MGNVIWLTGLSGSGKTTLSLKLQEKLRELSVRTELQDGDEVREFFGADLSYERKDRIANVKRIGFAAHLLSRNGVNVIVANIAPYYEVRDFLRKNIPNYIQIYLKSDLESSLKRASKGYYERLKNGNLRNFIGVDDVYDVPRTPDLTIDTINTGIAESVDIIMEHLRKTGKITEDK